MQRGGVGSNAQQSKAQWHLEIAFMSFEQDAFSFVVHFPHRIILHIPKQWTLVMS
jgi:hypothetical protein